MGNKYLFWLASDFHYIIAQTIINKRKIDRDKVYYVFQYGREIQIGQDESRCTLYDGDLSSFKERILFYIKKRKQVLSFFKGVKLYSFYPFRYALPRYYYFAEYSFFEEGLSSYRETTPVILMKERVNEIFRSLIVNLLFFYEDRNIKGYLVGFGFTRKEAKRTTNMYCLSNSAFPQNHDSNIIKVVCFPSLRDNLFRYKLPNGSFVIVLDRYSPKGRVYSLENYSMCLNKEIDYLLNNNVSEVWLKLHPVDNNNPDALEFFRCQFEDRGISTMVFNGKLEFLALQDLQTTFVGTNSTILFYAPLLGKSNNSVSVFKALVRIDSRYQKFIDTFGGPQQFEFLMSQNAECIE